MAVTIGYAVTRQRLRVTPGKAEEERFSAPMTKEDDVEQLIAQARTWFYRGGIVIACTSAGAFVVGVAIQAWIMLGPK